MPKRYLYPGTDTLKNRFGVKDATVANDLEYASYRQKQPKPVVGFTPDMAGLKATHRHLFGQMYEWAGKTRGETVTIDGETFKPADHILSKGGTQFGPASLSEQGLPNELARHRATLDGLHKGGKLTQEKWAELTADQVGMVNHAHPFRDGNGRTMRHYIGLSAERYGFHAQMKGGPEWVKASSEAMAFDKTQGLQKFIKRGTTKAEGEKNRSKDQAAKTAMEVDMAEATTSARDTTATTLRKASTVTAAASKAVSKIKDPKRRAEAQNLLDGMRKSETNLLKAQRQGKDQDRSTSKPEAVKRPAVRRDRDQGFDR